MEQLKQAALKIEKEIASLHALNKQLTENLKFLLEEEEIQECKNYELFKLVYGCPPTEDVSGPSRTKAQSRTSNRQHIELPSIYAPRGSRSKADAAPTPAFEAMKENLVVPPPDTPMESCMLPDEQHHGHPMLVDQVKIGEAIYLFADGKFYNESTGAQVGQLQSNIIVINGEPFTLNEKTLTHISDQYFTDGLSGVYVKCNEQIARLVGELRDENIYEFS